MWTFNEWLILLTSYTSAVYNQQVCLLQSSEFMSMHGKLSGEAHTYPHTY